eukprot:746156-Hanusia_phi.AAC.2
MIVKLGSISSVRSPAPYRRPAGQSSHETLGCKQEASYASSPRRIRSSRSDNGSRSAACEGCSADRAATAEHEMSACGEMPRLTPVWWN